ncbi:MAG: DUF2235 domain-containing protein [Deltaproteobacteria bacterium]|nr:DUF2235 domain-containing protein [Deltaproteobacteria bacterium]
MPKLLIFNFDGTDNEPQDAVQDVKKGGGIEDESITNILKFHLLIGGDLKKDNTALENGSRCFYYNGVGTYGNFFERKINAGLAPDQWDVARIINHAMADFKTYYEDQGGFEKIVVTGFSRGAAIARRFASLINDKVFKNSIIEGIFDTVASIGLPNLSSSDRPKSDVLFENGCTLPSNVHKALHLLSLDDKRRAFQPTLMNKDGRVLEVWFPGAHSDVGGGYFYDGLSDTSLRFFMDWFEDLGLGIKFLTSKTIRYDALVDADAKYSIGPDDVQIDPSSFGINHQQQRNAIVALATLTNRRCCVIQNDRVNEGEKPLIHWSAAERISGDRNYRPKSLENLAHKILYPDGQTKSFTGYSEHKQMYKRNFRIPDAADGVETQVFAYKKFNHTGILFEKGKSYKIQVIGDDKWNDGGIKELDGKGWDRDTVQLGLKEIAIASMEPFRRVTADGAKWFSLCGSIGDDNNTAFVIGNLCENYVATQSGEFCAFANDLDGYYGNNSGKLKIKVTLV